MAEQVSSLTSGVPGSGGLGTITGSLQGGVTNLLSKGNAWIDSIFPPEKREQWKTWLAKFATEKPYLASFLLSQLALSGPAIALFVIMALTVFVFALIAGVLIGVLGALVFIVFAVGFALIILLPVLFFTTFAGVFFFLFGMGTYFIIKWFNKKEVPGIHTDVQGGLMQASGANDLPLPDLGQKKLLNGDANTSSPPPKKADREKDGGKGASDKGSSHPHPQSQSQSHHDDSTSASTTGAQHYADGKENSQHHHDNHQGNQSHPRKLAQKSQSVTGKVGAPDVGDAVGGVGKKLGL